MQILYDNSILNEETNVVLGNFDGLHIGHMALINKAVNFNNKLKSLIYTFKNHPSQIINPKYSPKLITSDKVKLLQKTNVDYLYLEEFTEKFMKIPALDFIQDILINKLKAKNVFVGSNYRFGYKARGDTALLKSMQGRFTLHEEVPVKVCGEAVSSTRIRQLIENGEIKKANSFLGREYSITGAVVKGKQLGRTIGFPTINIIPGAETLLPKFAVYLTLTEFRGEIYKSITNVGYNPTFNEFIPKLETHILNFNQDLYNENVNIKFIDFIREQKNFSGVDELKKQLVRDLTVLQEYNH